MEGGKKGEGRKREMSGGKKEEIKKKRRFSSLKKNNENVRIIPKIDLL